MNSGFLVAQGMALMALMQEASFMLVLSCSTPSVPRLLSSPYLPSTSAPSFRSAPQCLSLAVVVVVVVVVAAVMTMTPTMNI